MKRYHSYKLPDDSIEQQLQQMINAAGKLSNAKDEVIEADAQLMKKQHELEAAEREYKLQEQRVIELMQSKKVTEVVLNRVEYKLVNGKLQRKLLID